MFKKVLIANRGLIAANCVRAVKELGAQAVVVYEDEDRESAGVRNADEAFELRATSSEIRPYLDARQIADLAESIGCDAVHPGYGFLAQNASFAALLRQRGIAFIAPRGEGVFDLSNKHIVKAHAARAGLPILPGSECFSEREWLFRFAENIGFPLVIKSAFGYGGIGLRVVHRPDGLENAWKEVRYLCERHLMNEPLVYLERYLPDAHHIEFPVLRDHHGQTGVLPELECSVQRRYQKLLVETPSPSLSPAMRQRLESEIRVFVERLDVFGFASVEFLVSEGRPYFLEINGYIQPSHTASTLLTGVDLLKAQIKLLAGGDLSLEASAAPTRVTGHVLGAYIFAEDVENDFTPSPGTIDRLYLPFGEDVYVQTSIFSGAQVSPFYDPMVAKLLVRGLNRQEAITKLDIALTEFFVEGVKTNIPLIRALVRSPEFRDGLVTAGFMDKVENRDRLMAAAQSPGEEEIAALVAALSMARDVDRTSIAEATTGESEASRVGAASRWLRNKGKTRG